MAGELKWNCLSEYPRRCHTDLRVRSFCKELEDENSFGTILIVIAIFRLSATGFELGVLDKVIFADWF